MYRLKTKRLLLRPYTTNDAPQMVAIMNDWEVVKTTHIPHPFTTDDALKFINMDRTNKDVVGGIFQQDTHGNDILIGGIGLHAKQEQCELGYWIGKDYWGQGYAYEACLAILEYGINKRGIDKIFATYANSNPKSGRILEKLGFTVIGTHFEDTYPDRVSEGVMLCLDTKKYKHL